MRTPRWTLMLLLVGCSRGAVPPTKAAATAPGSSKPVPSAELRRTLRTCDVAGSASAGEVEFGVRVDPSGKVALVRALRSTLPPATLNCTIARIRGWVFPTSEDGAAFRFTMTFPQRPVVADHSDVKGMIKHRTASLQHCYNKALRHDPAQFGQVRYTIALAEDGSVASVSAEVESQARLSPAVVACTRERIESWRFPAAKAEVGSDVSFSVVFTANNVPKGYRPEGYSGEPPPR